MNRKMTYKVDSNDIQEGSYVELAYVTYGEVQDYFNAPTPEAAAPIYENILTTHVLDWDWKDDEGNPMPKPKDCIRELFPHETRFLWKSLINPREATLKN